MNFVKFKNFSTEEINKEINPFHISPKQEVSKKGSIKAGL